MDRRVLFWAGLAVSVAVTAALWAFGVPGFFVALVFPFLFFPRMRPSGRRCQACHAGVAAGDRFCASCGAAL
jgi:hypothetical protein